MAQQIVAENWWCQCRV